MAEKTDGLHSPGKENTEADELARIDDQHTEEDGRLAMGGFRHGSTSEPAKVAQEELEDMEREDKEREERNRK